MTLATDVNLPRKHTARYPDRCVRCEGTTDGHDMRLRTHTIGWWTAVLFVFGQGFTTRVPACPSCGWKIRVQRIGGLILTLVIAALFMIFLWPHIDVFVTKALRKWVALGLSLFCVLPYFAWEVFWPPAIDITAFKDSVDYEFRSFDYACDFAEMKKDAEWVKIS